LLATRRRQNSICLPGAFETGTTASQSNFNTCYT
jgi:hypothetical protein